MNPTRTWMAAAVLALSALALPGIAAAQTSVHGATTVASYKAGLGKALNQFIPANNYVIALGNDLQKVNYNKAATDGGKAVSGIQTAKHTLDGLSAPSSASKIQSLMEKAFGLFLTGAKGMQAGAKAHNLKVLEHGLNIYHSGLVPLNQADALIKKLK